MLNKSICIVIKNPTSIKNSKYILIPNKLNSYKN